MFVMLNIVATYLHIIRNIIWIVAFSLFIFMTHYSFKNHTLLNDKHEFYVGGWLLIPL